MGCISNKICVFRSVPAGRVGKGKGSHFATNDDFREAIRQRTADDISAAEGKLQKKLGDREKSRIGVMQLRLFLEQLLLDRQSATPSAPCACRCPPVQRGSASPCVYPHHGFFMSLDCRLVVAFGGELLARSHEPHAD